MENQSVSTIEIRTPKKVLHFSDGVLEIFDDDVDLKPETKEEIPEVNESELTWTPWLMYKAQRLGKNVINGLDSTGEKIADFLNITTPKYAYEIEQYRKDQARIAKEEEFARENTWKTQPESASNEPITKPPKQSSDIKF